MRLVVYANAGPLAEGAATREECREERREECCGLRRAEREKVEREMRVAFMMGGLARYHTIVGHDNF